MLNTELIKMKTRKQGTLFHLSKRKTKKKRQSAKGIETERNKYFPCGNSSE